MTRIRPRMPRGRHSTRHMRCRVRRTRSSPWGRISRVCGETHEQIPVAEAPELAAASRDRPLHCAGSGCTAWCGRLDRIRDRRC